MTWVRSLLVCVLCCVPLGIEGTSTQIEYLIDLNVDLISTQDKEDAFVTRLQDEFQITFIQAFHAGSIRILHVSASEQKAAAVNDLPEINVVEKDEKVELAGQHLNPYCPKIATPEAWHLDRIDQRSKLDSKLTFSRNILATYFEGPYRGAGVAAYMVDTGIDITHPAFGNRAYWGYTVPGMGSDTDTNGHGTRVAGIVGAKYYGVASEVILIAIKIWNDDGDASPWSAVIAGLEWALNHHNARKTSGTMPKSVVNFSLFGGSSTCADNFLRALVDAGMVVVTSAGNGHVDACTRSPSRVTEVISVGASDKTDTTMSSSNWGSCVDLYAPGQSIKSTAPGGGTGYWSGTSVAAPQVTGTVALKFSKDTVVKTPAQMASWIKDISTKNKLKFFGAEEAEESPNKLLYVNCALDDDLGSCPG